MDEKKTELSIPVVVVFGSANQLPVISRVLANTPFQKTAALIFATDQSEQEQIKPTDYVRPVTGFNALTAVPGTPVSYAKAYVSVPNNTMSIEGNRLIETERPVCACRYNIIHSMNTKIMICLNDDFQPYDCPDFQNYCQSALIIMKQKTDHGQDGIPLFVTNMGDDVVLKMEDVENLIARFWNSNGNFFSVNWELKENEKRLAEIFLMIKGQTGQDFSLYKRNTIRRRIEKRMATLQLAKFEMYFELLKKNSKEVEQLAKEFLINVTHFFRDREAFETLEQYVVSKLLGEERREEVRIWVPACSSGEEAYTLAILFREWATKNGCMANITLFASDIDQQALAKAREGVYSNEALASVPESLVQTYFIPKNGHYIIRKDIRDMIIFAEQDIIQNPPFSKVDLISCRNLMIYLENETQQKVFEIFHYSLKTNGYLFLGNSESLGENNNLFKPVDRKWKIYRKFDAPTIGSRIWNLPQFMGYKREGSSPKGKKPELLKELAQDLVINRFSPPAVIVNGNGEILFIQGKIMPLLEFPQGEPSMNIIKSARHGLSMPLANAIRKARTDKKEVKLTGVKIINEKKSDFYDIVVSPLDAFDSFTDLLLVVFIPKIKHQQRKNQSMQQNDANRILELEKELKETQDYLQSTIEELETINEELKSSNEEAQSANEELQSANEELETSKEELQAINEELYNTNFELQGKIGELTKVNDDINNLYSSTQIATIFVNKQLQITRFTPATKKLINIADQDIDAPLGKFAQSLNYPMLIDDAVRILDTLIPKEIEIELANNRFYWVRILPYRTLKDTIEGVVLTFTDITEKKLREKELITYKNHLEELVDERTSELQRSNDEIREVKMELETFFSLIPDLACIATTEGTFVKLNPAWEDVLGLRLRELSKVTLFELLHPDDAAKTRDYLSMQISEKRKTHLVNRFRHKNGSYRWLEWMATVAEKDKHIYAVARDITDRLSIEMELKESQEKLNAIVSNFPNGLVFMIDHNLTIIYTDGLEYQRFELNPKSFIGRSIVDVSSIGEAGVAKANIMKAFDGSMVKYESAYNAFYYLNSLHPVKNDAGQVEFVVLVSQNITELKETQEALIVNKERYQSVFETAANIIFLIDAEGHILECNHRLKELMGYEKEEIVGKKILKIAHPKYWEPLLKSHADIFSMGKFHNQYFVLLKKNGDPIHANINASVLNDPTGKNQTAIYIVNDVTSLKQAQRELELANIEMNRNIEEIQDINYQLEKAKIKAEESDRLKSAFLANMSHEIRTPMNSIIGFSDLLTSEILPEEKQQLYCRLIRNSGEQLLRIINDIIDISKIESNQLKIEMKMVHSFNLINEIIIEQTQSKYFLEKPKVELKVRNLEELSGCSLYTDPVRLKQIFTNLINNAIKNTLEGYIELGFDCIREKEYNNILFYVKDTGSGIEKEEQLAIFNRFTQSKKAGISQGTGLGLSIVKGLLNLLGGTIWLESEPGKGSVFYFTLPLTQSSENSFVPYSKIRPIINFDLKGKTVYIAEDDESSYLFVRELLLPTQIAIEHAANGRELLDRMKEKLPDLVLLDINMPVLDGYETIVHIRSLFPKVPVIAQTVYALADEREECLRLGCADYICKPIIKSELFAMLAKYLKRPDEA